MCYLVFFTKRHTLMNDLSEKYVFSYFSWTRVKAILNYAIVPFSNTFILLSCFLHPLLYFQNTCFFYNFPFYFIWKFNFFSQFHYYCLLILLPFLFFFLYFFFILHVPFCISSRLLVNILLSIFALFLYHFLFKFDILVFSSFMFPPYG